MNRYGVIDLGTNTFHLLIVEKSDNALPFKELYRKREFVKLAEEGIETIGQAAYERGLRTLRAYKVILDELEVSQVKVIGTAALRTASNGPVFVQQIKAETDIDIELIDGNREAALIHKGVIQAVPFEAKNYLIMDIGGGSVEFIIADSSQVHWAQSFPIGAAVLYKKFHADDPLSAVERTRLLTYLETTLQALFPILKKYPIDTLVGASGTFDILEAALTEPKEGALHGIIPIDLYQVFFNQVVPASYEERRAMPDIPDSRADMIVVALLLIDFIVQKANIQTIVASAYAMKEGILAEMIV